MLQFLRRHQKFFFVFVTIMIVASFSFFGTFSALLTQDRASDRVIGKKIDGSQLRARELEIVKRLLHSSERVPNLLNNQFFIQEFIQTGLAHMLGERYFQQIKGDLAAKVEKAKHYRHYSHPQIPDLTAEAVWDHFAPGLMLHLRMIQQSSEEPVVESFALLCALYQDQAQFSPETLRRVLHYHIQSQGAVASDPYLNETNLSLFGFHSLEDWFGPTFVDILTQSILNISAKASKEGYAVSTEEARSDLFNNVYHGLKQYMGNRSPSTQEVADIFQKQLSMLGLDEGSAVENWQKVLTAKRYMNEQAEALFVDPQSFDPFLTFANQTVEIEQYQLPAEFSFNDASSFLEFQIYLEAIAGKSRSLMSDLPQTVYGADEIEKRYPELVESRFELEYREANKDELVQKVALKETWEWETQDENWARLGKKFPSYINTGTPSNGRFAALDKLTDKQRFEIDEWSRLQIVERHPEWVEALFMKGEPQKRTVSLRLRGGELPFIGVADQRHLLEFLNQNDSVNYSGDGIHLYQIQVVKRADKKEVLSFQQAKVDGTLSKLLDKRLEEVYPDIRKKETNFLDGQGEWKALADVKDQVGELYANDLFPVRDGGEKGISNYAYRRFVTFAKEALKSVQMKGEASPYLKGKESNSLTAQWLFEKGVVEIKRSDKSFSKQEDLFELPKNSWSSVETNPTAGLSFYRVLDRKNGEPSLSAIESVKEALMRDTKRQIFQECLELIDQKQAIVQASSHDN